MAVLGSTSFRAWWAGTNASIPSGWTRDTDWDVDGTRGRYFQVGSSGFTTPDNAGAVDHTHSLSHNHGTTDHTHDITYTSTVGATANVATGGAIQVTTSLGTHSHGGHVSDGVLDVSNKFWGTTAPTLSSVGTDPAYVDWILIKPDDANQIIPVDVVCFGDSAQTPPGMYVCDGNNGTTNWADKFPRGPATGGNGGGTGGTSTHLHSIPAHLHTGLTHEHDPIQSSNSDTTTLVDTGVGSTAADEPHHDISLQSMTTGSTNNSSATNTGSTTNEPAYIKLYALQNKSGVSLEPRPGMILGWIEAAANLPKGWTVLSSAYDRQVKITATAADLLATAGANTHSHTQIHAHGPALGVLHTHTETLTTDSVVVRKSGATAVLSDAAHGHTVTVAAARATISSNNDVTGTADGRMPYRTLLLAKYGGAWDVIFTGNGVLTGNTVLQ